MNDPKRQTESNRLGRGSRCRIRREPKLAAAHWSGSVIVGG
jgi:hypothetical protein